MDSGMTDEQIAEMAKTISKEEADAVMAFVYACSQVHVAEFIFNNNKRLGNMDDAARAQKQLAICIQQALVKGTKVINNAGQAMENNPSMVEAMLPKVKA